MNISTTATTTKNDSDNTASSESKDITTSSEPKSNSDFRQFLLKK